MRKAAMFCMLVCLVPVAGVSTAQAVGRVAGHSSNTMHPGIMRAQTVGEVADPVQTPALTGHPSGGDDVVGPTWRGMDGHSDPPVSQVPAEGNLRVLLRLLGWPDPPVHVRFGWVLDMIANGHPEPPSMSSY